MLEAIQRGAFGYFLHETNRANGLVRDKTRADWPASIAAVGLALTAYPIGVERGFVPRAEAAERTLTTLRFFWGSQQGPEPDATGCPYKPGSWGPKEADALIAADGGWHNPVLDEGTT
jgi:hypothetical protein